jgi:hypothetical protein
MMLRFLIVALFCTAQFLTSVSALTIDVDEINPVQSTLDATTSNSASGGRVNGLAAAPDGNTFYSASEWGGIWKSTDSGRTWAPLQKHLPMVTWDVEVDPSNNNRVYATSFYDGRVNSLAGINISLDGGSTWTKPATATPPANFCAAAANRDEPSAFGIAINPANSNNVAIGTNCGLALTTDAGSTWTFVNPIAGAANADDVWDVIIHNNGIIDVCGAGGHARSPDGGTTWNTATTNPLPAGRCSIAVSPDESYVLFAVVGTTLYESDDGGSTWPNTFTNPNAQGRIPYVATNKRGGQSFDLWFGDVKSNRATCTTPNPANSGGVRRCPSNAWTNVSSGAHDDMGDVLFVRGVANDACPLLLSNDGGVYYNTLNTSPGCHTPTWQQPDRTPRALWIFGLAGAPQTGRLNEDLYFGTQDDGTFSSTDAAADTPTWSGRDCCDSHDVAADSTRVLYTVCCYSAGRSNRLFIRNQGMTGGSEINTYPAGTIRAFRYVNTIAGFATDSYALVTTSGVFVTTNIAANPIVWTQLGAATSPANPRGILVGSTAGTPTFYLTAGTGDGQSQDQLWSYPGAAAGATWTRIQPPGAVGGFGIVAVDARNPQRIFASHLRTGLAPQMVLSTNAGAAWTALTTLDTLMTGGGVFRYQNTLGLAHSGNAISSRMGYPQPTLVAFHPADANILVAGGADSGVFLSTDSGGTWSLISDPFTPGDSGKPHIPRPRFVHFEYEGSTFLSRRVALYIGTQGRGVWRIDLRWSRIFVSICQRYPYICRQPRLDKNLIVLDCPRRQDCIFRDPIPKNCLVKYNCPGCPVGGMCPPYYHFVLENFNSRLWEVGIFTKDGDPVEARRARTKNGLVLSFRPAKELFKDGSVGDYELVFATKTGDRQASQRIKTRLEVSDRPSYP